MTTVHVVTPDGIDDPARPSGGNTYDRQVCRGLTALGWPVNQHAAPGGWPEPTTPALAALTRIVQRIPDGAVALVDGLIASGAPEVLVPHAERLRLVVLVHMPLGDRPEAGAAERIRARERAVLSAATSVVTTSDWSRRRLLELYQLPSHRLHVAEPGVAEAALATGTRDGGELLCVASVIPDKGHDVLLDALETVSHLRWQCRCIGRLDRDPSFVEALQLRCVDARLADRVHFLGAQAGADLDRYYAGADLLVLASRAETYGMVIAEALARGLPVVATDVGGVAEAVGNGGGGELPGLLVPRDDSAALGAALRTWLEDPELRGRWRQTARIRREQLHGWSATAAGLADVLSQAAR